MQCTVDFEYLASSASKMIHLINQGHDKSQLEFELNLRDRKASSPFKADAPWLFPAPKNFSPEYSLKDMVEKTINSNYNAKKNTFVDKFSESNVNLILPLLENSTTVYRNIEWQCNLRGDRKLHRTKKSPKKTKTKD